MATPVRSRTRSLLPGRRNRPAVAAATIQGSARLGRRTKLLVKRLGPEDVAIIDHEDLDRIAAEDLAATGVVAVVNVAPFSTGRYPNAGPLTLAQSGVALIEVPGAPLFDELRDGGKKEEAKGAMEGAKEKLTPGSDSKKERSR